MTGVDPSWVFPEFTDAVPGVVYLSGPMAGLPDLNRAGFRRYERWLEDDMAQPFYSPSVATLGAPDQPYGWYLKVDLAVIAHCAAVVLMPGWTRSKGCKAEVAAAVACGIPVYELPE